jgi:hypothetical protein
MTLGKEACFAKCHTKHSAKYLTWEPPLADSLPSAVRPTLGKGNFFAKCHLGHSAKTPSPSPVAITAAFLCRVLSGTRQTNLPSAQEKVLGKDGFADALYAEPSLPSATLGKAFAECFRHSAKPAIPEVVAILFFFFLFLFSDLHFPPFVFIIQILILHFVMRFTFDQNVPNSIISERKIYSSIYLFYLFWLVFSPFSSNSKIFFRS